MVYQGILGGLRSALNKGETLHDAMITFYNAGYKKDEIEAAAEALEREKVKSPSVVIETKKVKPAEKIKKKGGIFSKIMSASKKVSSYGKPEVPKKSIQKKKARRKLLIALLIVGLVFIGLIIAFLLST